MKRTAWALAAVLLLLMPVAARAIAVTTSASVYVKLKGDVTGDGEVDILDLAAVGLAFHSEPGDDNRNENADVNNDGTINIFDLAIVGLNYGRHV